MCHTVTAYHGLRQKRPPRVRLNAAKNSLSIGADGQSLPWVFLKRGLPVGHRSRPFDKVQAPRSLDVRLTSVVRRAVWSRSRKNNDGLRCSSRFVVWPHADVVCYLDRSVALGCKKCRNLGLVIVPLRLLVVDGNDDIGDAKQI